MTPVSRDYKRMSEYRVGNIYKYAVDGSDSYNETNASCRKLQDRFPGSFCHRGQGQQYYPG